MPPHGISLTFWKHMSKTKAKTIAVIACFALIAVIAVLGVEVYRLDAEDADRAVNTEQKTGNRWKMEYNGEEHKVESFVETYLLVGTDNADGGSSDVHIKNFYNHTQADFIALLAVDEEYGKVTAVQINRDTMTDVPWLDVLGRYGGTIFRQIALAYNSGSGGTDSLKNTAGAVSRLLFGLPVDHSVAFTMAGINTLNDLVGGVTVHIEDDLTPVDSTLKKGSIVTLHGQQAEHFLRASMALRDDTNTARMARHREYINGFFESAKKAMDAEPEMFVHAADTLSPYMVTEMSTDELLHLCDRIQKYGIDSIQTADGELKMGEYYEFYPDMDSLWSIVREVFHISE